MTRQNSRPPKKVRRRNRPTRKEVPPRRTFDVEAIAITGFKQIAQLPSSPYKKKPAGKQPRLRLLANGTCDIIRPSGHDRYVVRIVRDDAAKDILTVSPGDRLLLKGAYFPKKIHDKFQQELSVKDFSLLIGDIEYPRGKIISGRTKVSDAHDEATTDANIRNIWANGFVIFQIVHNDDNSSTESDEIRVLLRIPKAA